MTLGTHPFTCGLHDLGDGNWAWIQPDGGWGWSNAGLIVDGEESLLVDTLFDLPMTQTMLDAIADAVPDATITGLVNTHSNGDHCNGNELLDCEIIASNAAAEEMQHERPEVMAAMLESAPDMGTLGEFFLHCFGPFQFAGITRVGPSTTFDGRMERTVGDTLVELVDVGPAHTEGDVLVHVPGRSTVYTGDILFVEGHPILWAGTIPDLLRALDVIEAWQPETIVPGHGPITDLAGLAEIRSYLEYCRAECRDRFDRGMPIAEAARDLSFDRWSDWGEPERIVTLVDTCYREFGAGEKTSVPDLLAAMADLWTDQQG
ncbi:MAG: MBL fold metallo-hydrolase [Acidimicrobiales bacterium]|nr:MBL fold metallo-hydrolase [Acidimicrobiales bacterium]